MFNKKEYNQQWRLKNKERLKELEKEKWRDPIRRKKHQEYQREWYRKNPQYFRDKVANNIEHYRKYRKEWRINTKEKNSRKKKTK